MNITVLLPASEIPKDQYVHKVTGTKRYRLLREIKIYNGETLKPTIINAESGTVFLASAEGSDAGTFNAIPSNTMLAWSTNSEELIGYLEEKDSQ